MDLTKLAGLQWNSEFSSANNTKNPHGNNAIIKKTIISNNISKSQPIQDFKKDTINLRSSNEAIIILNTKRSKSKRQFLDQK